MTKQVKWNEDSYEWMGIIGNDGPARSRQYYGLLMSEENIKNYKKDASFFMELSLKSGLSVAFLKRFYQLYGENV